MFVGSPDWPPAPERANRPESQRFRAANWRRERFPFRSSIAKAIGLDAWVDISLEDMFTRGGEIQTAVEARIREKTAMEWDAIFSERGVVGGGVREISEVFETGQPQAREVTVPLEVASGDIHVTTSGYRVNDEVWGPRSGVPLLGEHTRAILEEVNYANESIDALIARAS